MLLARLSHLGFAFLLQFFTSARWRPHSSKMGLPSFPGDTARHPSASPPLALGVLRVYILDEMITHRWYHLLGALLYAVLRDYGRVTALHAFALTSVS